MMTTFPLTSGVAADITGYAAQFKASFIAEQAVQLKSAGIFAADIMVHGLSTTTTTSRHLLATNVVVDWMVTPAATLTPTQMHTLNAKLAVPSYSANFSNTYHLGTPTTTVTEYYSITSSTFVCRLRPC
jgi:hypothetical protein